MIRLTFTLIATSVFLLSGDCHAEMRTWVATNGRKVEAEFVSDSKETVKIRLKSGKIFEYPKNKLSKADNDYIDSLQASDAVAEEVKEHTVNRDEIELRSGRAYLKGSDTPFTGKAVSFYKDGKKDMEYSYKDGKMHGVEITFSSDGTKHKERRHKDGRPDGLWITWHRNGKKAFEGSYKNGRKEGAFVSWHEDGKKFLQKDYVEGKLTNEQYWNRKGEPVASREEALD